MEATEKNNEQLISLLLAKEMELSEMRLYISQLEQSYNDLAIKHNKFVEKYYARDKKRNVIGYKQHNQGGNKS